ncbi:MAG TPA: hypothetical protein VNL71_24440 [Chloroflexota bacterium]|nr:hypothetical protein [Chloroflexota bacterium]
MNEFSYPPPPSTITEELDRALAAQGGVGVSSRTSDELAQKILVGMQQGIEAQIDWRLRGTKAAHGRVSGEEIGLILGSVGLGVPLTALGGAFAGLPGIAIVWIGLILINLAWAVRR